MSYLTQALAVTAVAILSNALISPAYANLVEQNPSNQPCRLKDTYNWDPISPPEGPMNAPTGPWTASVETHPPSSGILIRVNAEIQHTLGTPACDDNHGSNPNPMKLEVYIDPPPPLANKASEGWALEQISHGTHRDVGILGAMISGVRLPNKGIISIDGLHEDSQLPVKPSFENLQNHAVNLTIIPDYRDASGNITDGPPLTPPNNDPTIPPSGSLPPGYPSPPIHTELGTLASLKYVWFGSNLSSTTVAFLGTVDGVVSEVDLDAGMQLLGSFVLPALQSDTADLFIGVDLTRLLGHSTFFGPLTFNPFENFTFNAGVSDMLPGFLVGTSPITLGLNGFETASLYNGTAFVIAVIDGEIPEPSTLPLMGVGFIFPGVARLHKLLARVKNRPSMCIEK